MAAERRLPEMDEEFRKRLGTVLVQQLGGITGTIQTVCGVEFLRGQLEVLLLSLDMIEGLAKREQERQDAKKAKESLFGKPLTPSKEELN